MILAVGGDLLLDGVPCDVKTGRTDPMKSAVNRANGKLQGSKELTAEQEKAFESLYSGKVTIIPVRDQVGNVAKVFICIPPEFGIRDCIDAETGSLSHNLAGAFQGAFETFVQLTNPPSEIPEEEFPDPTGASPIPAGEARAPLDPGSNSAEDAYNGALQVPVDDTSATSAVDGTDNVSLPGATDGDGSASLPSGAPTEPMNDGADNTTPAEAPGAEDSGGTVDLPSGTNRTPVNVAMEGGPVTNAIEFGAAADREYARLTGGDESTWYPDLWEQAVRTVAGRNGIQLSPSGQPIFSDIDSGSAADLGDKGSKTENGGLTEQERAEAQAATDAFNALARRHRVAAERWAAGNQSRPNAGEEPSEAPSDDASLPDEALGESLGQPKEEARTGSRSTSLDVAGLEADLGGVTDSLAPGLRRAAEGANENGTASRAATEEDVINEAIDGATAGTNVPVETVQAALGKRGVTPEIAGQIQRALGGNEIPPLPGNLGRALTNIANTPYDPVSTPSDPGPAEQLATYLNDPDNPYNSGGKDAVVQAGFNDGLRGDTLITPRGPINPWVMLYPDDDTVQRYMRGHFDRLPWNACLTNLNDAQLHVTARAALELYMGLRARDCLAGNPGHVPVRIAIADLSQMQEFLARQRLDRLNEALGGTSLPGSTMDVLRLGVIRQLERNHDNARVLLEGKQRLLEALDRYGKAAGNIGTVAALPLLPFMGAAWVLGKLAIAGGGAVIGGVDAAAAAAVGAITGGAGGHHYRVDDLSDEPSGVDEKGNPTGPSPAEMGFAALSQHMNPGDVASAPAPANSSGNNAGAGTTSSSGGGGENAPTPEQAAADREALFAMTSARTSGITVNDTLRNMEDAAKNALLSSNVSEDARNEARAVLAEVAQRRAGERDAAAEFALHSAETSVFRRDNVRATATRVSADESLSPAVREKAAQALEGVAAEEAAEAIAAAERAAKEAADREQHAVENAVFEVNWANRTETAAAAVARMKGEHENGRLSDTALAAAEEALLARQAKDMEKAVTDAEFAVASSTNRPMAEAQIAQMRDDGAPEAAVAAAEKALADRAKWDSAFKAPAVPTPSAPEVVEDESTPQEEVPPRAKAEEREARVPQPTPQPSVLGRIGGVVRGVGRTLFGDLFDPDTVHGERPSPLEVIGGAVARGAGVKPLGDDKYVPPAPITGPVLNPRVLPPLTPIQTAGEAVKPEVVPKPTTASVDNTATSDPWTRAIVERASEADRAAARAAVTNMTGVPATDADVAEQLGDYSRARGIQFGPIWEAITTSLARQGDLIEQIADTSGAPSDSRGVRTEAKFADKAVPSPSVAQEPDVVGIPNYNNVLGDAIAFWESFGGNRAPVSDVAVHAPQGPNMVDTGTGQWGWQPASVGHGHSSHNNVPSYSGAHMPLPPETNPFLNGGGRGNDSGNNNGTPGGLPPQTPDNMPAPPETPIPAQLPGWDSDFNRGWDPTDGRGDMPPMVDNPPDPGKTIYDPSMPGVDPIGIHPDETGPGAWVSDRV